MKKDFNRNFLKALRQEKNLTQQALADELGVSSVTVRNWESGRKSPSRKNRECLEEFFDISSFAMLNDAGQIAYANLAVALLRNEGLSVPVLLDAAIQLGAIKPELIDDAADSQGKPFTNIICRQRVSYSN